MRRSEISGSAKVIVAQLDRWASELKVFLMVLAVGLTILDGTRFTALKLNPMPNVDWADSFPTMSSPALTSALVR
jgi:hypothetical protein